MTGASLSRQTQRTPGFKVEDNATLLLDYSGTHGPVRAVLDVRWNSHVSRDEFRIIGTDGEIEMTPLNSGTIRYPGGQERIAAAGRTSMLQSSRISRAWSPARTRNPSL